MILVYYTCEKCKLSLQYEGIHPRLLICPACNNSKEKSKEHNSMNDYYFFSGIVRLSNSFIKYA